jgi:hypothetical protein
MSSRAVSSTSGSSCRCARSSASAPNWSESIPGARLRIFGGDGAHVHHVQHVEPEVLQVVIGLVAQLGGRLGGQPAASVVPAGADLGDNAKVIWVRREAFADDLVGDVRALEI